MRYYNICVKLSQRTALARSTSMGSRAPRTLARGFGARAHRRLRELTAAPRATHLLPPCPSAHHMVGHKPKKQQSTLTQHKPVKEHSRKESVQPTTTTRTTRTTATMTTTWWATNQKNSNRH